MSQAELRILRSRELRAALAAGTGTMQRGSSMTGHVALSGAALAGLKASGKSGVARESLRARHRWDTALRQVLIMLRVVRAITESKM